MLFLETLVIKPKGDLISFSVLSFPSVFDILFVLVHVKILES